MATFPFGVEATRCEPRRVKDADAFVLGVYPSALHVRWQAPEGTKVSALAVAPEPWPFWPGTDSARLVEEWRAKVPWTDALGTAVDTGPRFNGSSGAWVEQKVLAPLGRDMSRVWLTDALPFYFVKPEGAQDNAVKRYNNFANVARLHPAKIPERPSAPDLVRRALDEESARLKSELRESATELVITLGNEALGVIRGLADDGSALPRRLRTDSYGSRVPVKIDGRRYEVLPLKHPGQRGATWKSAHDEWVRGRKT